MFNLLNSIPEYSNTFVVLMGIGTVFTGLIVIIAFCYIMSFFVRKSSSDTEASVSPAQTQTAPIVQQTAPIENKQELVAAISAAVAENLGKDVSAIRITSIKRV